MHLNINRLDKLIERVEQCEDFLWGSEKGVDPQPIPVFGMLMEHHCGSPCCLMGHIADLAGTDYPWGVIPCSEWLGIAEYAGEKLFIPIYLSEKGFEAAYSSTPRGPGYINKERALRTLRTLRETGKVDWGKRV